MRAATARADLPARIGATHVAWRHARAVASSRYRPGGARGMGIAVAVACHVLVLAALWHFSHARSAIVQPPRVVAQIITLPHAIPQKPPAPPVPKPMPKPAVKSLPPLVQQPMKIVEAPSRVATLVDAPPLPAPVVTAAPVPAPVVIAPPVPAPPAPAITPPRFDADYLRNPPPEYPAFSKRRGEEGRVLLRVHVTRDGAPREVELKTSSGSERLDHAALEAVKRWKFVPARLGDTPVDAWVLVPIAFSLDS
jgi:protein TonB